MSYFDSEDDVYARLEANDRLDKWTNVVNKNHGYRGLKELLGITAESMRYATPEQYALVYALAGPNGYTVYKMLLARKDNS